jgi:oligopeptidase B
MKNPETAPVAPRSLTEITLHEERIQDEYAWLRERENPRVLEYLQQENEYTRLAMEPTARLQGQLFEEMRQRCPEDDHTAPVKDGKWLYYSRTEQGRNYRIRCRRRFSAEGTHDPEEVLLDGNQLAAGKDYFELGTYVVSPDHRLLAYSMDFDGGEKFLLKVRDLECGIDLPDEIPETYYGAEWSACGGYLFYTTLDAAMRPWRLHRHRLGTPASDDVLVYQEDDQAFHIEISKTRSARLLVLEVASLTTSETWLLDCGNPEGDFEVVLPRKHMQEYHVEHQGDWLWLTINDTGRNFRLVRMPLAAPTADSSTWQEILPHRPEVCLEGVDAFARFLVVSERDNHVPSLGLPRLLVMDIETGEQHRVAFPESVYAASVGANAEYETETLRIAYESPVTPPTDVDYGMRSRAWTVVKQQEVRLNFKSENYRVERLAVPAPDGTLVPLSVVSPRDLPRDGSAPALLYGYGAYGLTTEAGFSSDRLSLLERGFVFAIAHVRGGGDLGETWHDAGKMEHKPNSFSDFIACAEALVARGYTSPSRLGILGRSAGGLLVAATMNQRPELFGAVVASVPFVDVLNTMLDPSLPLTVGEYEEWGNPQNAKDFALIRSYSPYENVREAAYPHLLVTAGLHDPRVSYWEPAKLVARIRQRKTNNNICLLKTELGAGHFGPSGRYDAWKETAFEHAFLMLALGVVPDVPDVEVAGNPGGLSATRAG